MVTINPPRFRRSSRRATGIIGLLYPVADEGVTFRSSAARMCGDRCTVVAHWKKEIVMALFRLLMFLALLAPFAFRATTEEGSGFDPHGRPVTSSSFCDEGSGLDPHGGRGCTTTTNIDRGPLIDPNG
jgi:hypothetical protein